MNRIYQGRVTNVELANVAPQTATDHPWAPVQRQQWEQILWEHHQIFQDAVNYYIVAIASLGVSAGSRLTELRAVIAEAWEKVEKQGEKRDAMKVGLMKRFSLSEDISTLTHITRLATDGKLPDALAAEKVGEMILERATGEAGIRNAGRRLWPQLSNPNFGGNPVGGSGERLKEFGAFCLNTRLHELQKSEELQAFAGESQLGWVVLTDPQGKTHSDPKSQLVSRVDHFLKIFEPNLRKINKNKTRPSTERWLRERATAEAELRKLKELIGRNNKFRPIPLNNKGDADRISALLLFQVDPTDFTARLLKFLFPHDPDAEPPATAESDDETLNSDAFSRARGEREYVLRAFTSFSFFGGSHASDVSEKGWSEFDIAAFKEALTVVNQFNQNVTKREYKLNELATKLLVMDGEKPIQEYGGNSNVDRKVRERLQRIWQISKGKPKLPQPDDESDGEGAILPTFGGDRRIHRLREIVSKELAEEYRLTEGRTTPYGLRRRTMKGWSEVKRKWQGIVRAGVPFSDEKKAQLQTALNDLRKIKSEQIGSHKLFEALIANEDSWSIWREPTEKEAEDIDAKGWSFDPLESFRAYCETKETLENLSLRSLSFTPADARRSRRLFGFKEVCSFGKAGGEFKHDPAAMAVIVPLALVNERGVFKKATVRVSYSAPRFLRDQIRDTEGRHVQRWIQPMVEALCSKQMELPRQQLEDAAVELMPDWDKDERRRFLLNFSLNLQPEAIAALLPQNAIWQTALSNPEIASRFNREKVRVHQFVAWDKGAVLTFLRWPSELQRHLNSCLEAMKKHRHWTEPTTGVDSALAAFCGALNDEDRAQVVRQFLQSTNQQGETANDKKRRTTLEYALLLFERAWWRNGSLKSFHALAADLGTRHGATVARIEASDIEPARPNTARFIGEAGGRKWFARLIGGKILRLPGEDAQVVRHQNEQDLASHPKEEAKRPERDFREELHGDRGRSANADETRVFFDMMKGLDQLELLPERFHSTEDITQLRSNLSFPEQNDKLLIAIRRTQGRLADLISQHWRIVKPEKPEQIDDALRELNEQERYPALALMAADAACRAEVVRLLDERIRELRQMVKEHLLTLTERVLPVRRTEWQFAPHPDSRNFPDCHLLEPVERATGRMDKLLRGQRGISMLRIEQLSELRRRWQSLNQSLRRQIGERPLTAAQMRERPIPDPCPAILRKLEELREQRVNQIAHLVVVEALGLRLRIPQKDQQLRCDADIHGEYERVAGLKPADFIVLEHLNRYKANQGRAKSENTRLMQWCHRAVVAKIKELAETFGIPVLETPAAYSSRFCSLTGIVGFRAVEVGLADREEYRWRKLLKEADEKGDAASTEAKSAKKLFLWLEQASAGRTGKEVRTLLAPQVGGPIFVTAENVLHPSPNPKRRERHEKRCRQLGVAPTSLWVSPIQADLGAASNLAFRAVAHPDCADIHHRLRSERVPAKKNDENQNGAEDTYRTREKRRFGETPQNIVSRGDNRLPKERNPNLFYDVHCVAQFDRVRLERSANEHFPYATGRGLWTRVNKWEFQWDRCEQLNKERGRHLWDMTFTESASVLEKQK